jgi:hypothetical protein
MKNQSLSHATNIHRLSKFLRYGCLVPVTGLLLLSSACRIQKDSNGNSDDVKISTPFGGMNVSSNGTNAAAIGLPAYPGARAITKKTDGDDGSVDLHMGFGPWQLHVQVANYGTGDSQDKVVAFYKQALGKYGAVIECSGGTPIGTPTQTSEGLNCSDDVKEGSVNWSHNSGININELHLVEDRLAAPPAHCRLQGTGR